MSLKDKVIGIIGGGNMAKAIAKGILLKSLVDPSQIIVSALSESTLREWALFCVETTRCNSEVIQKSDVIILAFKPNQLDSAMKDVVQVNTGKSKLFVSILAGTSSEVLYTTLAKCVEPPPRVVRVMPNTPVTVCEGVSAIAPHVSATEGDIEIVKNIFSAIGKCEVFSENLISPITGLTGSGPAYVYLIIEALSDGAVKQGLPRETATAFAAQTVLGAAKMVLETKKHPGQLKDEVCSAGGTTIHALHALERGNLRATLMNGIEAAVMREKQMGQSSK